MKRIALTVALLAGLAGCGPDCDRFCKHWVGDCATQLNIKNPNVNLCIQSCNEVGSDYAAFINFVEQDRFAFAEEAVHGQQEEKPFV